MSLRGLSDGMARASYGSERTPTEIRTEQASEDASLALRDVTFRARRAEALLAKVLDDGNAFLLVDDTRLSVLPQTIDLDVEEVALVRRLLTEIEERQGG